jgi:hypothetical protein
MGDDDMPPPKTRCWGDGHGPWNSGILGMTTVEQLAKVAML